MGRATGRADGSGERWNWRWDSGILPISHSGCDLMGHSCQTVRLGAASLRALCSIPRALPQPRLTTGMSTSTPTCTWLATTVATAMFVKPCRPGPTRPLSSRSEDPSPPTPPTRALVHPSFLFHPTSNHTYPGVRPESQAPSFPLVWAAKATITQEAGIPDESLTPFSPSPLLLTANHHHPAVNPAPPAPCPPPHSGSGLVQTA